MVINTLTDLNDLITNGTGPERLAFKNIIVGGLNAQDLADIITSSNRAQKEALAALVVEAENFLSATNKTAADAQRAADLATAQTWYDSTVLPTLTWDAGQTGTVQLANSVADRNTLKALNEADQFRNIIIKQNIEAIRLRIRAIKLGV